MKKFLVVLTVLASFATTAQAGWGHGHHRPPPRPYPNYPNYPAYPVYPPVYAPQVTCFAQGTYNGVVFYGTGPNVYTAQQYAMYACQSTGQYCVATGCRY